MHQLLTTQNSGSQSLALTQIKNSKGINIPELVSLTSFEIIKHLHIPLIVYLALITFEFVYMITIPAQRIFADQPMLTTMLFRIMTAQGVYLFSVGITGLLFVLFLFILVRGNILKDQQTNGEELVDNDSSITNMLIKGVGIGLIFLTTALSQLFMRVIPENLQCDKDYEIEGGCDSSLRSIALYASIAGIPLLFLVLIFTDVFITMQFPNERIPWAAWNDRSRLLRNGWKMIQILSITFIPPNYQVFINFFVLYIASQLVYERYQVPQVFNRAVHLVTAFLESQLFAFTLVDFSVNIIGIKLSVQSLFFVTMAGVLLTIGLIMHIDSKESSILTFGSDPAQFEDISTVELYLVVMLHELERLTTNEEYAHEKHVHAIIGRHMEDCSKVNCPCKSYEPEYDKKFNQVFLSKRMTKSFNSAVGSGQGSSGGLGGNSSLADLKRLPYKINYRTKVEIFKKEFEDRIQNFLEEHPKSCGIKLLKSFFNHKFCDSSYKALFVQLENSITTKDFKGKVFIYHLKTLIQDEMKKSTESPLSIDINSLLRFEKYKIDFERNLEDLSYNCQLFWTDLSKDDYKVEQAIKVAYQVSWKIIQIKRIFGKIININHQCIDTSSTYALVYRHILRDEATFNDLVNRIQQIKNSSKLEQQREHGIRFFDSDIYALLMVSGELKELGRIKQANSSNRFVFGYDPKDLIGSRINKVMPGPFSALHDRFMMNFLAQGKSNFLDRNQPLPIITKEGFLQMTLFYVKPMVSLEFGLIFASFARKLNQYNLADDSPDLIKLHKLCVFLTDKEGFIYGMSESCSKKMGIPPPSIGSQLSLNDNQRLNIAQVSPMILQSDYEFELVKGLKMNITTKFLKKERQFRREYPEYASKLGEYKAEIGIHKYLYRDLGAEINIYVVKIAEKEDFVGGGRGRNYERESERSKSEGEDELTYSEFSITTANSSVISGGMATSKFKTFKSKIQTMTESSQINRFSTLALITFLLLLGIAAGNFAINLITNQSYMRNLDVITNLQILMQQVPEQAHSTRQLILINNQLVKTTDAAIAAYPEKYNSKYMFYAEALSRASLLFENIQNHLQTTLNDLIALDTRSIQVKDVKTDGTIGYTTQSIQTSINLFSSKILKISAKNDGAKGGKGLPMGIAVPNITFNWNQTTMQITDLQQDLFFIIENGLGSIFEGIRQILSNTKSDIMNSSDQASVISIILTAISIVLVLVLLPMSFQPLTHVERISRIILMSLNRLPEQFCQNETKACMEIIMFLNEQKEGEKSTHEMIKKHDHRKQNKQLLKLPKKSLGGMYEGDSMLSSTDSYQSDADNKSMLYKGKFDDNQSTHSRNSSLSGVNVTAFNKNMTKLSNVKAPGQQQPKSMIKRGEGGTIELDITHAKTSEVQQEATADDENDDDRELTEEEQKQKDREHERKEQIDTTFRGMRIKKFLSLIITAFAISVYYAITCFYLNLIHQHEKTYLDHYSLIGRRIQCYTNVASYLVDSLARNSNMTLMHGESSNAAWYYLQDCYEQEQEYKQLMLDGLTIYANMDTFNSLNDQYEGSRMCSTLAKHGDTVFDGVRTRNVTYDRCIAVSEGILNNGGLTETLFHSLKNIQDILLIFEDRMVNGSNGLNMTKTLLKRKEVNELISLHEIYIQTAFERIRADALVIIQDYFAKLNRFYNMLFGLFVSLLSLFQILVTFYMVKKLSLQIVMIYHVVLLIPFSGRTQNDLNTLMMIKM